MANAADGPDRPATVGRRASSWTFLTNHAHVLVCLRQDPEARVRDLAAAIGITERAVHRILGELAAAGYVTSTRTGRRKRYRLEMQLPLRHPLERAVPVRRLLDALADAEPEQAGEPTQRG